MKTLVLFAVLGAAVAAQAAELPEWAYPAGPPATPPDAVTQKSLPGSTKAYTQAQIDDRFNPPDWYPQDHPPMPDVVAHGKRPNVSACDLCHLTSGGGHPESAGISGLPLGYIMRQMAEFKAEARKGARAPVMVTFAKGLSEEETKAAAEYFAGLKYPRWYKVVEADTVPKSYVGKGAMRFAVENGGTEPIGNRIIELPQNDEAAESRDPRTGFVAFVPTGSIKKGETLVATGGGKTLQCTICHGADLKGVGDIPPIAGRSPMYIYRQLNDIKIGVRQGAMVPLMKPVVANLTEEDMVALAAYLVSKEP